MHTFPTNRFHHQTERLDHSIRAAFITAGSLLISIMFILILFFGIFLERIR